MGTAGTNARPFSSRRPCSSACRCGYDVPSRAPRMCQGAIVATAPWRRAWVLRKPGGPRRASAQRCSIHTTGSATWPPRAPGGRDAGQGPILGMGTYVPHSRRSSHHRLRPPDPAVVTVSPRTCQRTAMFDLSKTITPVRLDFFTDWDKSSHPTSGTTAPLESPPPPTFSQRKSGVRKKIRDEF